MVVAFLVVEIVASSTEAQMVKKAPEARRGRRGRVAV